MALVCTPCLHVTPPHWHLLHRLPSGDTLPLPCAPFPTQADGAWWVDALVLGADWDQPPEAWLVVDRLLVGRLLARLRAWQAGEGTT